MNKKLCLFFILNITINGSATLSASLWDTLPIELKAYILSLVTLQETSVIRNI